MTASDARPGVLIVDDEPSIRELLSVALRFAGFTPRFAADGDHALAEVARDAPALILLDIMMPGLDGVAVARRLREAGSRVPIIFLTAKDQTRDKVRGLELADDYVTKPFSMDELIARIQAVMRRAALASEPSASPASAPTAAGPAAAQAATITLRVGRMELDEDRCRISVLGQPLELSPTEYQLLGYLMENANRVVSKQQIMSAVWPPWFSGDASIVETYISSLRRKLSPLTGPHTIRTRRGFGYVLDAEQAASPGTREELERAAREGRRR